MEEFWATAQYLLGSSSRQGKVATGLWGPWVFTDNPGWEGDFTLDYSEWRNTSCRLAYTPPLFAQRMLLCRCTIDIFMCAIFRADYGYLLGVAQLNHPELVLPYFKPLMDYYPLGMRSRGHKNCSGLSLPAHIGPWGSAGSTTCLPGQWLG